MLKSEQPNLAEIQIREEIRDELQQEIDAEQLAQARADRDRRFLALLVSMSVLTALLVPALAAVAGISIRIFWWAAGY